MDKVFEIISKINAMNTMEEYFEVYNTIEDAFKAGLLEGSEAKTLHDLALRVRVLRDENELQYKIDQIKQILKD